MALAKFHEEIEKLNQGEDASTVTEKTYEREANMIFKDWHGIFGATEAMQSEAAEDRDEEDEDDEAREVEEDEMEDFLLGPGELMINGAVIPVHDWLGEERTTIIVSINGSQVVYFDMGFPNALF